MKSLYLVDVSSLFFRAFYAIPPLSNKKGQPTNALHGLLSMTTKLLREFKPDYLAFCYDRKEPSFRKGLYPEYKAQREAMPDDLALQVPYIKKLASALGIPQFELQDYEADDLIGSLCRFGLEQKLEVVIVSGDKDFAQLVGPSVSLVDTMKDRKFDSEAVKAKWGIRPGQMIDYLALVGDSSDNIPGVRGIGPKTAEKLLQDFGSLEKIYEQIEIVKPSGVQKKLIENKEMAFLSQKLVTIVSDLHFVDSAEELEKKEVNPTDLEQLLDELEFKSFKTKLLSVPSDQVVQKAETPSQMATVAKSMRSELVRFEASLANLSEKVSPYSDVWLIENALGIALAFENNLFIFNSQDLENFRTWASGRMIRFKGFDLKKLWHRLELKQPLIAEDLMLAHYTATSLPVSELEQIYEFHFDKKIADLPSFEQIYEICLLIESKCLELLRERNCENIYRDFEVPLVPVLYEMEVRGVGLDCDLLKEQSASLHQDLLRIEGEIYSLAGEKFNILSPKQLAVILFEKLGLEKGKKTKTGFSTGIDVLEKLKSKHPLVALIIEYRELSKLKSTYVDALPQLVSSTTQRVHTEFRQALTTTGRLSSANPNLQNIPIRTERGRMIREAFVPARDHQFLVVDYSQIELRILAHLSEDAALIRAFQDGQDIHQSTASEIFEVALDQVSADMRRQAKAVNFGIAYGQGAFGLAESLNIERKTAQEIIDRYFKRFAGVKNYMQNAIEKASRDGFVETLFGRRRYVLELKSKNPSLRKFGERAAINAPIQGTASDLVKKAMIELRDEVSIPMVLQVHDELIFEAPRTDLEEEQLRVKKIMESVAKLNVPLKVNMLIGPSWSH